MKYLSLRFFLLILMTLIVFSLEGHDGHEDTPGSLFIKWLGNFHPVILHFPIALILMTGFTEVMAYWTDNPVYKHASRFMILAAAFFAVPTALFGLAYSYGAEYSAFLIKYFWWHRTLGLLTVIFVIAAAYFREYRGVDRLYYVFLILACISVIMTGFFGGSLTFGPYSLYPAFLLFS
jgi:uncharacterized membrane protein